MVTTEVPSRCPTTRLAFVLDGSMRFDISPAKRHGDVKYVFDPNEEKPSIWSVTYYEHAVNKMLAQEFDPDIDYLVAAGSQVPLLLLVATLVARFGQINLLLFDSTTSEYIHKRVSIDAANG